MNKSVFDQLYQIVEQQLTAARKLDGEALNQLTQERSSIQDQITLTGIIGLSPEDRSYAHDILLKIKVLDNRIRTCAQLVLDSLSNVMPVTAPLVYNARGYLRGH